MTCTWFSFGLQAGKMVCRAIIFGHTAKSAYGLVMSDGTNKFIGAGSGFRVQFYPLAKNSKAITDVCNIDEGTFKDNSWTAGRRLNGDEDYQGR
jgi:hypothetical protein